MSTDGLRLAALTDLAGTTVKAQIDALKLIGWNAVELRRIDGRPLMQLSDWSFDAAVDALQSQGIAIVSLSTDIASCRRPATTLDFQVDVDEMKRAVQRIKRTDARMITCMSYSHKGIDREAFRTEVIRRLHVLARMAADAGVLLVHENYLGYGGEGAEQSLDMLAQVDCAAFKLMLDTGNGALNHNDLGWTLRYYEGVKDHVAHVRINAVRQCADGKVLWAFPEQDPTQRTIVSDLRRRGYEGWVSINPQLCDGLLEGHADAAVGIFTEYARQVAALAGQPG